MKLRDQKFLNKTTELSLRRNNASLQDVDATLLNSNNTSEQAIVISSEQKERSSFKKLTTQVDQAKASQLSNKRRKPKRLKKKHPMLRSFVSLILIMLGLLIILSIQGWKQYQKTRSGFLKEKSEWLYNQCLGIKEQTVNKDTFMPQIQDDALRECLYVVFVTLDDDELRLIVDRVTLQTDDITLHDFPVELAKFIPDIVNGNYSNLLSDYQAIQLLSQLICKDLPENKQTIINEVVTNYIKNN